MKQGFIIPVYRHGRTACQIAERLAACSLPVILVDDGNDEQTQRELCEGARNIQGVFLARLEKNSGKGGAVICGLKKASELGITHALQVDADGQHDTGMVNFFLEESKKHPDKVICGCPEFDESAPKSRITGRKISVFWAAVVTLSSEFKDLLCGFRVYPVDAALKAAKSIFIDKRMGFDPEILVRLYWKNTRPVYHPIKVIYPKDGISNFNIINDNIRISWMFTRLFFGMLPRSPVLVMRNIKHSLQKKRRKKHGR